MRFLVGQTERITGLKEFGKYMNKLFVIDAFFLNEDRHTHNIAVLMNKEGKFEYCPIFDNGAGLLADTSMDYPLHGDTEGMKKEVQAKTICIDFDEQLDISERLYHANLRFLFTEEDVQGLLEKATTYPVEARERVADMLYSQMRKYQYLFFS